MSEQQGADAPDEGQEQVNEQEKPAGEQKFTQADLDRIVSERVARERTKFADYDDLKARASEAKTAEERIADLEKQVTDGALKTMRRDVALSHSLTAEDAKLLDDVSSEDAMRALAERLAADNAQRRRQNHVPHEGRTPSANSATSPWTDVLSGLRAQRT